MGTKLGLAASVLVGIAIAAAEAAVPPQPAGTWSGRIRMVGPNPPTYRPTARLVIGRGGAVTATFRGLTGATHDAPNATTTCRIRYRFFKQTGAWLHYLQYGRIQAPHGYVANSPCIYSGDNALRVKTGAGARLRADFGTFDKEQGSPVTFDFAGAGGQDESGSLRRSG